jgi:hypothetical protein
MSFRENKIIIVKCQKGARKLHPCISTLIRSAAERLVEPWTHRGSELATRYRKRAPPWMSMEARHRKRGDSTLVVLLSQPIKFFFSPSRDGWVGIIRAGFHFGSTQDMSVARSNAAGSYPSTMTLENYDPLAVSPHRHIKGRRFPAHGLSFSRVSHPCLHSARSGCRGYAMSSSPSSTPVCFYIS